MKFKTVLKIALLLVFTASIVLGIVGVLLKREPEFYIRETIQDTRPEDSSQASEVVTRLGDLRGEIFTKSRWGARFSAAELNAFCREGQSGKDPIASVLLESLNQPRVGVDGDVFRLAFRKGDGFFSTVFSVGLKMWLVKDQTNVLAVEIVEMHAGSMPLSKRWTLDSITQIARDLKAEVTWYRHNGNPVGLFRLFANQTQSSAQVLTFKIEDNSIAIGGQNLDIQETDGN